MSKAVFFFALVGAIFSTGCDYYRYPCQDQKNWDTPECKPPVCTVTQTCPEDLLKPEVLKGEVR